MASRHSSHTAAQARLRRAPAATIPYSGAATDTRNGPQRVRSYAKRCTHCNIECHASHYIALNGKAGVQESLYHYDTPDTSPKAHFASTNQTYLDHELLIDLKAAMQTKGFTFLGYTTHYNRRCREVFLRENRQNWVDFLDSDKGRWLNNLRLEDAFFKHALFSFLRAERVALQHVDLGQTGQNLDRKLLQWFPKLEKAFEETFAHHVCDSPGCTTTLVADGHMKCRRFVCANRNANYVELDGFPNG
eukprot:7942970-Pyramimonas_sp.AAC.1